MPVRARLVAAAAATTCCVLAATAPAHAQSSPATGTIVSKGRLAARATPGGKVVTKLRPGTQVTITCQQNGPVAGPSAIWDRIVRNGRAMFVGDGYVTAGDGGLVAGLCGAPPLRRQPPPGATSGACSLIAPVALAAPYASVTRFIAAAVPGAQRSQAETAVPASVTLAQAILETGGGRLAAGANNYFGMKAQAVTGQTGVFDWGTLADGCVLRKTQEVVRGRSVTTIGAFRAYAGLADSIRDHGARLRANPVYAAAFDHTDDPERFARIIARHYATDPRYGTKVVQLMHRYKLERYDKPGTAAPPAPTTPPPADGGTGGAAPGG